MYYDSRTPENQESSFNAGPYLARVVNNIDPKYMGTLQVQLLRDVGNIPDSEGTLFQVKYLTPFYGVTSLDHNGKNNTFGDTQKSYGMWMVPPDVGVIVLVTFVEGDPKQGYWLGCVQDEFMNFMIPGLAATEINTENPPGKKPVAEFNKKTNTLEQADTTQIKKPIHPLASALSKQGLITDEHRGITTSSARRESPSNVFGISTPGPIDRSSGAPRGNIGTKENRVSGAFVSRLGGTTLVMDDGDDNFLRKKPASEGPPDYASIENDEKGGDPKIPHNELFRIRTRTGHQILLHNSEDLIYIGNARGTTWIELTSNGKIDIFAEDSVSIHTKADLNVTADNNINLTASNDVNIKAGNNVNIKADADYNIKAGGDGKLTVGGQSNINAGGNHVETAAQIHMNGPSASTASDASPAPRVPQHEPWSGHENLHNKTAKNILDTFKKIGK
jgi:hypothetical protein